jgi:rhomboid family GlyGly-CTERM serine protease
MIAERPLHSRRPWLFALLASLVIFGLQLGAVDLRFLLQYWIHLDWRHACMNAAGLWLLAGVDTDNTSLRMCVLRSMALSLAVGLMLYVGVPALQWYVGLSGVLHGLFTIVLLRLVCLKRDYLALLVLSALIGKLVWEHYHGALTQGVLGAPVIVSAHSYGALAGLVYAMASSFATWHDARRPDIQSSHTPRK